ncbi:hypothetical protein ONV78_22425 [Hahella sp. CR1]|uniref:hypothetical protein n=1 Tax=Hahella sp. CR1 TaxID=2992807 RepID=UPI002441FB5C|nr:hypothetical protein [Hahella sp. CR1]MDG9670512.1 hypothetical protein [Hahella sp. CR1]
MAQSDGYWLHSIRKAATEKVKDKGAHNYIHRMQQVAAKHSIKYKGISKPQDFWDYLQTLLDDSISRVWYSGHASGAGLFLSLDHNKAREPVSHTSDIVEVDSINLNKSLINKFSNSSKTPSKFYGCYTSSFAKRWSDIFKVKAEGAVRKVDFGVLDRPSTISNVMERIEKTPTTLGSPGWATY